MANANKKLVLFKIEATEGTDATPLATADAVLTRNFVATPLEAEFTSRELDLPNFGALPSEMVQQFRRVVFEVEWAGSGTAATAPAWMKLLSCCGFNAGVPGVDNVVQSPITPTDAVPGNSATIYYSIDNLRHRQVASRGNATLTIENKTVPFFSFDFLGAFANAAEWATEVTPSTAVYTAWKDPIRTETANTSFELGGYAVPLRSITIDLGNTIEGRSLIGPQDRIIHSNRSVTASAIIEVPSLAAKNYFANVLNRQTMALEIEHGSVAGQILLVDAPKVQLNGVEYSEEQGRLMATLALTLLPDTGNDEIIFTSK